MLVPRIAVEHFGDAHLEIAGALGRRSQSLLIRRLHDQLSRSPISRQVLLERLCLIELGIAFYDFARPLKREDLVAGEDALPGPEEPRSDQIAGPQPVAVCDVRAGV